MLAVRSGPVALVSDHGLEDVESQHAGTSLRFFLKPVIQDKSRDFCLMCKQIQKQDWVIDMAVFRIRDPVPFWPLDPGWVKKSRSGSRMDIPGHIPENLITNFWVKKIIFLCGSGILNLCYPGSEIFVTQDPGWKKIGSRINIPDPQHWLISYRYKCSRMCSNTILNYTKNSLLLGCRPPVGSKNIPGFAPDTFLLDLLALNLQVVFTGTVHMSCPFFDSTRSLATRPQ